MVCIGLLAAFWPQMLVKPLIEGHSKVAEAEVAEDKWQAHKKESKVVKKTKI